MFPLRDNIRSRTVPFVNYAIIGCTSLVFLLQVTEEPRPGASLTVRFGMIPLRVLHPEEPITVRDVLADPLGRTFAVRAEAERPPVPAWLTLLTCIFLHGGWLHFLGNMWFLHIFGDNVEDRLGHLGFLFFYLGCGAAASAAHLASAPGSTIPTIGASGAIAGVMGAYFLLYPKARVLTLVPIFYFIDILVLPAPFFLGLWFLLQFFQGTLSITATETGGVAWWAHIGGFVAGLLVALVLRRSPTSGQRRIELLPGTTQSARYRRYPVWRR